jgi:hypothetical protein
MVEMAQMVVLVVIVLPFAQLRVQEEGLVEHALMEIMAEMVVAEVRDLLHLVEILMVPGV